MTLSAAPTKPDADRSAVRSSPPACILPRDYDLPYLNDSKKLSEKRREELYELITQTAEWAVGSASPREIDELNILNASQLAMRPRGRQSRPHATARAHRRQCLARL